MTEPPISTSTPVEEVRDEPFRRLRTRTAIPWMIVGIVVVFVGFGVAHALSLVDLENPTTGVIAMSLAVYGTLAAWLAWAFRHSGIDFRRLVGSVPPGYDWFPALGILLASMVFSYGSVILTMSALSLVAPGLVEWLLEAPGPDSATGGGLLALAISAIVIAPFFEEVAFRGVLINRWGTKWGIPTGIVASAALFGLGHPMNVAGTMALAVIAAILYFKTRTLLVPMAVHALNNAVASVGTLLPEPEEPTEAAAMVQEVRDSLGLGVVMVVVSLPVLVWYIRRNWPGEDAVLPYEAPVEPVPSEQPVE